MILPSSFQQFIHKSKYARYVDESGRREEWNESVSRLIDFWRDLRPEIGKSTYDELERAVVNLEIMPSMRTLMTAGPALARDNVAGYNCFPAHTQIMTKQGLRNIGDVVGEVTVLDGEGNWVKSEVKSFGKQPINKITLRPGDSSRTELRHYVYATPNHRWVTENRGEVTDLQEGDIIRFNSPSKYVEDTEAFIRGFGFGDGTLDSRGRARVRLCGEKDLKWVERFEEYGHCSISYPEYFSGDALVTFHKGYMEDWKTLPSEYNCSQLASWFQGYFEADGCNRQQQPVLCSQDSSAIEFAKKCAPYAGYMVTGQNTDSVMETNLGRRSAPLQRITLRREGLFKVMVVNEMAYEEEVYCAVVPTTKSFTLSNGLLTGNCAYTAIDNVRAFDEIMYILMCGTGVGFSVERQYINKLPEVAEEFHESESSIRVRDSKIGWASAYKELIAMLYAGNVPKWDDSGVRASGERLKTFGGRASGPEPLQELYRFTIETFKSAAGRKLNSLEVHDLVCKIAQVIVVGGVRRSALISLSNLTDQRMRNAKSGEWYLTDQQRSLANNSVAYTERPDIGIFMEEWHSLYRSKSGERGIFNRVAAEKQALSSGRREASDFGTNPCSEIILRSKQFCNLTEVVVRSEDSLDDLKRKVRLATILGTLQATLTNFRYLSKRWRDNTEDEALLGVSLTGIMDHTVLAGRKVNPSLTTKYLKEMKDVAIDTNKRYASKLGINQATAITCVKPSGTVSQLVDSSSGIHPRYASRYIRTVRADSKDPLAAFMVQEGFPVETDRTEPNNLVFSFPVESPDGAVCRDRVSALDQLELWKLYQENWCEHKPSITVYVRECEWLEVGAWCYRNFDILSGVAFLPHSDHAYAQAPYQDIGEEEFKEFVDKMPTDTDWNAVQEGDDYTTASQELACQGGHCEL